MAIKRRDREEARAARQAQIDRALWYSKLTAVLYLAFVVSVPIIAWVVVLITGKNTVVANINNLYSMMSNFMKVMSSITPGDYVLGAVVVLYHKRFKPSLVFLAAAGLLWLFGNYSGDGVSEAIKSIGIDSHASLALECLYVGLTFAIVLTSIFVPTLIAYERKKSNWKRFLLFNLLVGWIPPVWVLLVFFATKPQKGEEKKPAQAEPEKRAEPRPVHKNELRKKKGFKKK